MASEYSLKLKATLDTTQVQQQLNMLNNAQHGGAVGGSGSGLDAFSQEIQKSVQIQKNFNTAMDHTSRQLTRMIAGFAVHLLGSTLNQYYSSQGNQNIGNAVGAAARIGGAAAMGSGAGPYGALAMGALASLNEAFKLLADRAGATADEMNKLRGAINAGTRTQHAYENATYNIDFQRNLAAGNKSWFLDQYSEQTSKSLSMRSKYEEYWEDAEQYRADTLKMRQNIEYFTPGNKEALAAVDERTKFADEADAALQEWQRLQASLKQLSDVIDHMNAEETAALEAVEAEAKAAAEKARIDEEHKKAIQQELDDAKLSRSKAISINEAIKNGDIEAIQKYITEYGAQMESAGTAREYNIAASRYDLLQHALEMINSSKLENTDIPGLPSAAAVSNLASIGIGQGESDVIGSIDDNIETLVTTVKNILSRMDIMPNTQTGAVIL